MSQKTETSQSAAASTQTEPSGKLKVGAKPSRRKGSDVSFRSPEARLYGEGFDTTVLTQLGELLSKIRQIEYEIALCVVFIAESLMFYGFSLELLHVKNTDAENTYTTESRKKYFIVKTVVTFLSIFPAQVISNFLFAKKRGNLSIFISIVGVTITIGLTFIQVKATPIILILISIPYILSGGKMLLLIVAYVRLVKLKKNPGSSFIFFNMMKIECALLWGVAAGEFIGLFFTSFLSRALAELALFVLLCIILVFLRKNKSSSEDELPTMNTTNFAIFKKCFKLVSPSSIAASTAEPTEMRPIYFFLLYFLVWKSISESYDLFFLLKYRHMSTSDFVGLSTLTKFLTAITAAVVIISTFSEKLKRSVLQYAYIGLASIVARNLLAAVVYLLNLIFYPAMVVSVFSFLVQVSLRSILLKDCSAKHRHSLIVFIAGSEAVVRPAASLALVLSWELTSALWAAMPYVVVLCFTIFPMIGKANWWFQPILSPRESFTAPTDTTVTVTASASASNDFAKNKN